MPRALTPEDRLLLLTARPDPAARDVAELSRSIERGIAWDDVVERASREGTASLLYAHVGDLPCFRARAPASARVRLRDAHRAWWAFNTVLLDRWEDVTTRFRRAGVPSLTLKGIALVHTVYPDLALRPMIDVDLLVRPADVARASAVLEDAGYRPVDDGRTPRPGVRPFARGSTFVDLQWDLARYFRTTGMVRVDHDALWRHARPFGADGAGSTLSPEHTLLTLALHLTIGSEFGRTIWFSDIDGTIRRETLDWDVVVRTAERWRVREIVAYAVGVVAASLATPLPASVRVSLRPGRARTALVGACVATAVPPSLHGMPGDTRVFIAEALLMDRWRDVLRVVWRSVFPVAAWLRLHYQLRPDASVAWYRCVHPARVAYLALTSVGARAGRRSRTARPASAR